MHFSDWWVISFSANPSPEAPHARLCPTPRSTAAGEDRAPETTDSSQMPLRDAHRLLLEAAALFLLGGCSGSSSHSVRFHYEVWDSAEGLPQFMGLGYLDDQIFIHFDKKIRQPEPVVPWMKKLVKDDPEHWNLHIQHMIGLDERLKQYAMMVQKYGNQSESFLTWQGIIACELREDGQKVGNVRMGYNGRDFLSFDKDTLSWIVTANAPEFKRKCDTFASSPQYYKDFLEGDCIEWLKKYIKYAKESLQRREPPVVKVLRKMDSNGLETLICRAYGFYPREIHATWKKDGEFLEQEPLRGDVVPNSDGTYHTWTGINIDPKDRAHYQCQVEHVGFPEPHLFAWKEPGERLSRGKKGLAFFATLGGQILGDEEGIIIIRGALWIGLPSGSPVLNTGRGGSKMPRGRVIGARDPPWGCCP
ncbi:major histocompatibility complex class I-related gene protein-like isoform X2 [Hemicordylus capensis]|uniref:major histocompatibility complex class I-related gene protein-like isoform X2 n=1 Tax=Hemicordylus capensis TaxID=884348 RepID=UPI00230382A1|nr:major histocompatibility complex class I-related gene protein-like isoform X2 [Hemicordylus capensis]